MSHNSLIDNVWIMTPEYNSSCMVVYGPPPVRLMYCIVAYAYD